ncbi:MAG: hypothetical protein ACRC1J_06250 [Sandaracinobacteroides sp.]
MRALSIAALAALSAVLTACGSDKPGTASADGTSTSAGGSSVTVDQEAGDDRVTITSKDGDNIASMVAGSGAQWPASAPAYAPPYPGGAMVSAMSGSADGKSGGMASFETTDTPDKVIAYYKAKAAAAGLEKVTTMAGDGMTMFAATDATGDTGVSVQASVSEGKTMGSVSFNSPDPG